MKRFSIIGLILLCVHILTAQNVEIFEKKSKMGIKLEGKIVVKPIYQDIDYLFGKFFNARENNQAGVIDINGNLIVPFVWDDILSFQGESFLVHKNGKWGIMSRTNNPILPANYIGFEKLNEYIYIAKGDNKKVGLINRFGDLKQMPIYDKIESCEVANHYLVESNGKIGLINDNGETVIPAEYQTIENMGGSYYKVSKNGKLGIVNYQGKPILETVYDKISEGKFGMWELERNGKIGFITNNFEIIPPTFDRITYYDSHLGIIALKQNNKYGFLTKEGKLVKPIYDNLSRFSGDGKAIIDKNGRLMKIDFNGKEISL